MNQLLTDRDPEIRAIAIGALAKYDGLPADDLAARAVTGIDDGLLARKVIKVLRCSKTNRAVPVLIAFLDGWAALAAQRALKELTGYSFPPDVKASREAWEKAKHLPDATQRRQCLAKELPYDPEPLKATLVRDKDRVAIVLTNQSQKPVSVVPEPTEIELRSEEPLFHEYHPDNEDTQAVSVILAPGQSIRFQPEWDNSVFANYSLAVTLWYLGNGKAHGTNAWIGELKTHWDLSKGSR